MERKPIFVDPAEFPCAFRPLLSGHAVYDSSCSSRARVFFLPHEGGCYLKTAPKGALREEAALNAFYHSKGLGPEVLAYLQEDADWMLTRALPGEDCLSEKYLQDPKRLCDTTAHLLRMLHDTPPAGCPVSDRAGNYVAAAGENYALGKWDESLFPDNWGYVTVQDAWAVVQEFSGALRSDTLLHGDYCLPNILLNDWQFSGFIDLGAGGVGDRHIDLFWGVWSLNFNLKTDAYAQRFLDAYGRDRFDPEILNAIGAFEVFR